MDRNLDVFAPRSSRRWAAESNFAWLLLWAWLAGWWRRPVSQAPLPSKAAWRQAGLHEVSIGAMRPHPERACSYDEQLRPLQASLGHRWVSLRSRVKHAIEPPIEVLKVGDVYYVLDGHAHASVAHAAGCLYLQARVWEALPTLVLAALRKSRKKPFIYFQWSPYGVSLHDL